MRRRAVIHTHHKTGTVWMRKTFRQIGVALKIPVAGLSQKSVLDIDFSKPMIALDPTSRFPVSRWQEVAGTRESDRFFHLIRDPRDVIISAAHYHTKTDEPGFHVARDKFDGLTYQQKINGLGSDRERYIFEMDHFSKNTLNAMARWDYQRPDHFEAKYEDLMVDQSAELFGRIVVHLGFEGAEIEAAQEVFLNNSIASGVHSDTNHVRSGAVVQWKGVYDRGLASEFLERFGDVLIKLGYETDASWASTLPTTRQASAA